MKPELHNFSLSIFHQKLLNNEYINPKLEIKLIYFKYENKFLDFERLRKITQEAAKAYWKEDYYKYFTNDFLLQQALMNVSLCEIHKIILETPSFSKAAEKFGMNNRTFPDYLKAANIYYIEFKLTPPTEFISLIGFLYNLPPFYSKNQYDLSRLVLIKIRESDIQYSRDINSLYQECRKYLLLFTCGDNTLNFNFLRSDSFKIENVRPVNQANKKKFNTDYTDDIKHDIQRHIPDISIEEMLKLSIDIISYLEQNNINPLLHIHIQRIINNHCPLLPLIKITELVIDILSSTEKMLSLFFSNTFQPKNDALTIDQQQLLHINQNYYLADKKISFFNQSLNVPEVDGYNSTLLFQEYERTQYKNG